MPISQLLFSFRGRLNRLPYWFTSIAILVLIFVVVVVLLTVMDVGASLFVIIGVLYIPLLWIAFALGAKRLHDRDKSAWWLLLFGCSPGTVGPNRFGPDPLEGPSSTAATAV
jgi:uncharacterized membrane protein YhaH (DUF805 family)